MLQNNFSNSTSPMLFCQFDATYEGRQIFAAYGRKAFFILKI
ncbi:hypothetical protein B4110_0658 [Parageobacillus toebii]|uniref:Uncharacterized protein n=1 Tax=Parageobacillus toebii TaxID=153151 RepID=A0A150MJZ2_9BACL|nr:hypothetical protein B4110_0658 [Parageobacillus toebii]